MNNRSLTILGAIAGVAILFGSMGLASAIGFTSTSKYIVTRSQGLTLEDALKAYGDEATRNSLGVKNILIFDKSGGSMAFGEIQSNLKVDLPVKVEDPDGSNVSLQYFVDVKNDLTPDFLYHCSDIRLLIYLDGHKIWTTGWMGYDDRSPSLPLQTNKLTIHDVASDRHEITLIPEGRVSGCNVDGYILSWGGTAVLFAE